MPEYLPRVNRYSAETQKTCNNLPFHSKIRRERSSVGQSLINATFGAHAGDVRKSVNMFMRDHFVTLASLDQPDIYYSTELDPHIQLARPESTVNLLHNSSFEIWTNELRLPDWWFASHDDLVDVASDGIIGDRCISFNLTAGSSADIWQVVPTRLGNYPSSAFFSEETPLFEQAEWPLKQGIEMVFSVWYMVPDHDGSVDITLRLDVECHSRTGALTTYSTALSENTAGVWRRGYVAVTLPYDCDLIWVNAEGINGTISDFPVPIYIDACQFEFGTLPTLWEPHINDRPFHLDTLNIHDPAPVVSEHGHRAQFVETIEDFWFALPTRLELICTEVPETVDPGRAGYTYEVDFWKKTWTTEWVIDDNDIVKRGIPEQAADQYGRYLLAPTTHYGTYEDALFGMPVLHALTYFRDKLWIVATLFNWTGTPDMYLFVANPDTPWPEPEYLEVPLVLRLRDWPGGTPVRVEFKYEDQQHIYITTATDEYCYRLYYDYFMINELKKRAFFRENLGTVSILPTAEPAKRRALLVERK